MPSPTSPRTAARPPSPLPSPSTSGGTDWARAGRLAARLGFAAALVFACTAWCQGFYRHFAHAKSFALWIALAFGVAAAVASWRGGRPADLTDERELRRFRLSLLLVGATWFLSLVFAVNIGHGLEDMTRIAPILLVGWWAAQRPLSWRRDAPWATGLMMAVTVVILLLGLMQWKDFQDWIAAPPGPRQRSSAAHEEWHAFLRSMGFLSHDRWLATLGNANSAASYYALAMGLMGGVFVTARTPWRRVAAALLFAATLKTLLLTESRGGKVAGLAVIVATLLVWTQCPSPLLPPRPWHLARRLARVSGFLGGVLAGVAGLLLVVAIHWVNQYPSGQLAGSIFIVALSAGVAAAALVAAGALLRALAAQAEPEPPAPNAYAETLRDVWNETAQVLNAVKRIIARPARWIVSSVAALTLIVWVLWLALLTRNDTQDLENQEQSIFGLWQSWVQPDVQKRFLDRLYIWQSGARMIRDFPLGIGWGQFPLIYPLYTTPEYYELWSPNALITTEEAHSGHLNLALETGVPGTLAWASLFIFAWMGAMRRMRWASEGDEASRAVLAWFPLGVTMAIHMGLDKFWAYPASLTALMWSLGTMVRPRSCVALAPAATARVIPRPLRPGLPRLLAALGVAVIASASALHIGAGSHYMTRSRMHIDEADSALRLMALYESNPQALRPLREQARESLALAENFLDLAREHMPWEIDAWSRSLDAQGTLADAIVAGLVPQSRMSDLNMAGHVTVSWLLNSILISPNYYPVQRNLGNALLTRAADTADEAESRHLVELAIRMFEQVLSLRDTELITLIAAAETLEQIGSPEAAIPYYERYVNFENARFGGIDVFGGDRGRPFPDPIRVRLGALLENAGRPEEALAYYRRALVRAREIDPLPVMTRVLNIQISLGRYGEAARDFAAGVAALNTERLAQQFREIDLPLSAQEMMVSVAMLIHLRETDALRALIEPASGELQSRDAWLTAAVIARAASADYVRELLAAGRRALPEDPALVSAEAELLR